MRIKQAFTEHPASVGETYFEHLRHAAGFSVRMIAGGLACLVHALIPCLFTRTGSDAIRHLHDCMVVNRQKQASATSRSGVKAPAV
jgi:hypothetical protein